MTNERKLIQSSSIIRQYNPSVTLIIHQKPRRPTICMYVCMYDIGTHVVIAFFFSVRNDA